MSVTLFLEECNTALIYFSTHYKDKCSRRFESIRKKGEDPLSHQNLILCCIFMYGVWFKAKLMSFR